MIAALKRCGFHDRKRTQGLDCAAATMPSYFPLPVIFSRINFPSLPSEKVDERLSPSASMASHTTDTVFFPSSEAFIPTHRKVFLSNIPPGGLLRVAPVSS
jgi:hypothetical protein